MSNPIYKAINSAFPNNGTPMFDLMTQFTQFRNQMQGKNPEEEIQKLLQSGKISQQQLNQAQQMAMQMRGMFSNFMK